MPSLHLDTIGTPSAPVEIHALTAGHPFRGYRSTEIADPSLFRALLRARWDVLAGGRPIYCTAVRPDPERRIESNPHDDRPGVVHLAAIDVEGCVIGALSVAVDLRGGLPGPQPGLPLENRLKPGRYPGGCCLDEFRARYPQLQYGERRSVKPWEQAELYRHFVSNTQVGRPALRLALYAAAYRLLVTEARIRGEARTTIWLFDAIARYFRLYMLAGAALREPAIADDPRWVTPTGLTVPAGSTPLREVPVPIPTCTENGLRFDVRKMPFYDGVVDIRRWERAVERNPWSLEEVAAHGMSATERLMLRLNAVVLIPQPWTEGWLVESCNGLLRQAWAVAS